MVLDPNDCGKDKNDPNKFWLFWFGDHRISQVDKEKICNFKEHFLHNIEKTSRKVLVKAMEEALLVLAIGNDLKFDHKSSLLSWASRGFQSNWSVRFYWAKSELPLFIKDVLPPRMETSEEESDMEDNVVAEVLKGERSLEDICIACCKENVELVEPHPIFAGRICTACKKDVKNACALPASILQSFCIVCGQGGTLVYCSDEICSRAYCKLCIEYLHSKEAYVKIVKKNYWQCYLCSKQSGECLIKQKVSYENDPSDFPISAPEPMETDDVIKNVLIGERSLEDICIACCKNDVTLIIPHPLFVGKVCRDCKKDVSRAYCLPPGKFHACCIICGQGGTLVYCTNNLCYRAFCLECITYLHPGKAFAKIVKNDIWLCYLCKPVEMRKCLIRRRDNFKVVTPDPVPVYKSTEGTYTSNETSIVKKAIFNREKCLEDVCIACCKENAKIIDMHPLFIGRICRACKKDVSRICNLPCGKFQDFCIVCGQGGKLVYCGNNFCLRAYCQPCVEYLDSEKAFLKIIKNDNWLCYLCEPKRNAKCLIKKRFTCGAAEDCSPASAFKLPANTSASIETGDVIEEVLKGKKSLEDICIACCKENVKIIAKHPFFVGNVCKSCKKDVVRVCCLPSGKFQRYCIICGQGGYLVFCSIKACSKAFCQLCIEYLDSENAYAEIVKNYDWSCYLCETSGNNKCLIKKRNDSDEKSICDFKPILMSKPCADAPDSTETGDVVEDVLKGKKSLEDICIACCKENVKIVAHHPLFIGKVCKSCEKDVARVCSLSCGKFQKFCIVCGQGGSLLFCTKNICSRAFCKLCIEYLDSKQAISKIVKNDDWLCYLCETTYDDKCLIKKREISEDTPSDCLTFPVYEPRGKASKTPEDGGIKKLRNGEITFEDICIACCKYNIEFFHSHPLFMGRICPSCDDDVKCACKLPIGHFQEKCVVCGQGGELVYCCNCLCFRGYCKLCIEYLDFGNTYNKIVKNNDWFCYFCDMYPSGKSLIKRQEQEIKLHPLPPVPELKEPIAVISCNEIGLPALRRAKIKVKSYDVETSVYDSFCGTRGKASREEWAIIPTKKPDLVLGSWFVKDHLASKIDLEEDHFRKFTDFQMKWLDCLCSKPFVFFIFLADISIMDAHLLERTAFYLNVHEVPFHFGKRKFLAWSNLCVNMPDSEKIIKAGPYIDDKTVEETIYCYFLKYMQDYFEMEE